VSQNAIHFLEDSIGLTSEHRPGRYGVNAISSIHDQIIVHMDTDQAMPAHTAEDQLKAIQAFIQKRNHKFKGN